jgi:tetratricopeptide (TPR) repeat protein
LFKPGRDDDLAYRFGFDVGVAAMANLAISTWVLGDVERATSLSDSAEARLSDTHTGTRAFGNMLACMLHMMRRDPVRAASNALEVARLAREHDLTTWRAFGLYLESWATAENCDPEVALRNMHRGAELLREQNMSMFDGLFKIVLAEVECRAGDLGGAVATLDEALAICERTGQRAFEAELHRVRGELLLERDPAAPAPTEETYKTAIGVARAQGARSFELRAGLSLAKLYQSTARPAEAHAVLAPALEGFSPTPEMPEIAEAQALIAALAETEEVKAAEAHHQRRLHLQTAYGQAMMMAKGFAAEETRAAFARAAELTQKGDDFLERFAALQGQYSAATTAGELRTAQGLALTILQEAEDAGWIIGTGWGHSDIGLVAYWRGEFVEARAHCERALTVGDLNLELRIRERFVEASAFALSVLAATVWQLGEVDRARELIDSAIRRASETGHVGSIANALFWKSYLEIWRGDPVATLSATEALERVAREHGMPQYLNEAELHSGWARGRITDPMAGAAQVRQVLTSFVDQHIRVNLGFYTRLLAELEAETLGPDGALARIDEAFRLSDQVEHRCSLPFLHRLRGEILFKRNPADPAPAEEAFRTSIAIAKEQGARSPVLLASLALAKLLQSTARTAGAHAVLAAALEGFSPTPEMPEIADARALLAALDNGA